MTGTGKSTLVKYIVAALGFYPEEVAYVAYTGKAATVLKNKGCPNAVTAHKLLYRAHQRSDGTYAFTPRERLEHDYQLIVVDEVSMLPQELWYQLLSHGVYVLAMGDPGQLPPVKEEANPILEKPHVFLDEVMRQAQESAIIRLSMHIREGKDFRLFPTVSGEVKIVPHKREFADEDLCLLQASQVICGTNQERNRLNFRIRELLGKGSEPEPGDKIISLKNHWDDISPNGNALTNGAIGTIIDYKHFLQEYPRLDRFKDFQPTDLIYTNLLVDEDDEFSQLPIDYKCLTTGDASLTSKQEYQLGGYNKSLSARARKDPWFDAMRYSKDIPYQFNYGYAITCWKAQGSEYPYVLGYEASWLKRQKPDEYKKYLYTLVTRATDKVIIIGD